MPVPDTYLDRITESRKVLYDPSKSAKDYVNTYEHMWADSYNKDGQDLGFQSWEHSINAIEKHMPNRDAKILDFCGGTGQVGKRLHAKGYRNLHIADGSSKMMAQAKQLGVYTKTYLQVVEHEGRAEYLENGEKYDVVLSSMSLSEFKTFVKQVVYEVLKPGGIFVAIESIPHIEMAKLDGIPWVIEEAAKPDTPFRVVENNTDAAHDTFTDHKMIVLVVQRNP